jgi:leucyl-tRNA synthetase
MIRSEGKKMSKSRGKTVAPDALVEQFGADAVRSFLMFLGPFDQGAEWNDKTEQLLTGVSRFLNRVWNLVRAGIGAEPTRVTTTPEVEKQVRRATHKTIKRVEDDLGHWAFNTALSGLMEYSNILSEVAAREPGIYANPVWQEAVDTLLLLLAPLAPHIAEELWQQTGHPGSIHNQRMPAFDPALAVDEVATIIVQINGKVRDKLEVSAGLNEDEVRALVLASPKVAAAIGEGHPKKVIYVPGKLVNIVV